jgi:hypothetical protein
MFRFSPKSVASALLCSTVLFTASWGCGGGSTQNTTEEKVDMSSLAPAPDATVFVEVKAGTGEAEQFVPNVKSQLVTSLSGAGYKLVESADGKPDIVARVTVNATQEQSFFQVQVNGKVQASFKVAISASFVSAGASSVIDQATSEFSGKDGVVEQSAIDKIVVHLGKTGKLTSWAHSEKAKIEAAEDDLWKAGNVEGCKKPTTATACDGVKAYLEKYPTGKHAAEARAAMQEGETAAAAGKEEDVWKAAMVDQCKKPTKSYDCKGVEDYVAKYPTGAHVAEGKEAMKASEKAREGLKKAEDAKKKAASRDDCIKECRRSYETYRSFEVLVARCVQTECN